MCHLHLLRWKNCLYLEDDDNHLVVAADILLLFDSLRTRKDVNTLNTSTDTRELFPHSHSSHLVAAF